jgi:hypothetical protein
MLIPVNVTLAPFFAMVLIGIIHEPHIDFVGPKAALTVSTGHLNRLVYGEAARKDALVSTGIDCGLVHS